jgi:hypothetical protein
VANSKITPINIVIVKKLGSHFNLEFAPNKERIKAIEKTNRIFIKLSGTSGGETIGELMAIGNKKEDEIIHTIRNETKKSTWVLKPFNLPIIVIAQTINTYKLR